MPDASVVDVDNAGGGIITGGGQAKLTYQGDPLAVVGDAIASHGGAPHDTATVSAGSAKVTVAGLAVARAGDAASCGHTVTGSSTIAIAS